MKWYATIFRAEDGEGGEEKRGVPHLGYCCRFSRLSLTPIYLNVHWGNLNLVLIWSNTKTVERVTCKSMCVYCKAHVCYIPSRQMWGVFLADRCHFVILLTSSHNYDVIMCNIWCHLERIAYLWRLRSELHRSDPLLLPPLAFLGFEPMTHCVQAAYSNSLPIYSCSLITVEPRVLFL